MQWLFHWFTTRALAEKIKKRQGSQDLFSLHVRNWYEECWICVQSSLWYCTAEESQKQRNTVEWSSDCFVGRRRLIFSVCDFKICTNPSNRREPSWIFLSPISNDCDYQINYSDLHDKPAYVHLILAEIFLFFYSSNKSRTVWQVIW